MKRIRLEEFKTITGRPFRKAVENEDGTSVLEQRKDADGKPVMQIPRDAKGEPIPNVMPEPLYQIKTVPMGKETLGEILKGFYLRMPPNKTTRLDNIQATRMFQNIAEAKNGYLELDDDVHKWLRAKLQDPDVEEKDKDGKPTGNITLGLGSQLLGVNLTIIEDILDNFERKHEPKGKGEGKSDEENT